MLAIRILIDADGCPVVDLCISIAGQYGLKCFILCDTSHIFDRTGAETLTFSKGTDSVDFALVNLLSEGDIAVTQDYGLAAMCLAKKGLALSQNGMEYTSDNIDALLLLRNEAKNARRMGIHHSAIPKRTREMDVAFARSLREIIVRSGVKQPEDYNNE